MKTLWAYVSSFYKVTRRDFRHTLIYMLLSGLAGGAGIALLAPLLSLTGITGEGDSASLGNLGSVLTGWGTNGSLIAILFFYVALVSLEAVVTGKLAVSNSIMVQGFARFLRTSLYRCLLRAEWGCVASKRKSDVVSVFTNEIARVAAGTVHFLAILSACVLIVIQVGLAFWLSPALTLLALACGGTALFLSRSVLSRVGSLGEAQWQLNQELLSGVSEQMNGIREVRIYGIEETQLQNFEKTAGRTEDNLNQLVRFQAGSGIAYKIFAALLVCVLLFLSRTVLELPAATLLVLIYIFARLWPLFASLHSHAQGVAAMLPAYSSLMNLQNELDAHAEHTAPPAASVPDEDEALSGPIRFEDVSFSYTRGEGFALRDLSFAIPDRGITALAGNSGAGKTTIVDLLLGLLQPGQGRILAGATPIDEMNLHRWRSRIGYVPQESFLFSGSIRENLLRFCPSADEERLWTALEAADAAEFVRELPEGPDTSIGDNGIQLSGGQRQRIVLARALLGQPKLLILDEATASLDGESEERIHGTLKKLAEEMSVVVIAHNPSVIKNAGWVVVVEQGQVAEQGGYDELAGRGGGFSRMLNAGGHGESRRVLGEKGDLHP